MVSGTIIGSDNTGAAVVDDPGNLLGNGQHGGGGSGIVINGGASLNTIGGTTAGARDVILGNKSYGVYITGSSTNSNTIEGDVIGTDITGLHATDGAGASYGNGLSGVAIDSGAAGNVVTGTPSAPEVISNNGGDGVLISGSNDNDIFGVDIGTDINGANALPNAGDGVAVNSGATGNYVGFVGFSPNIISGNAGNGVSLTGTSTDGNAVVNDLIGLAAGGKSALGNGGDGVLVDGEVLQQLHRLRVVRLQQRDLGQQDLGRLHQRPEHRQQHGREQLYRDQCGGHRRRPQRRQRPGHRQLGGRTTPSAGPRRPPATSSRATRTRAS